MATIALVPIPQQGVPAGTLFAIEEHLAALEETAELVSLEQEQQFLAEFQQQLTAAADKRDRVARYLAHLEAQQAFAAREIARLQAFKKAREAEQSRLEGYVAYVIESLGKDSQDRFRRLEGNSSVLFLRACPASVEVTEEAQVPLDYKAASLTISARIWSEVLSALNDGLRATVLGATGRDIEIIVDKRAVKAAIDAGIAVPGTRLVTDKTTVGRK